MTPDKKLIGQTELIGFPELRLENVVARVDTGATTSAIWASNIEVVNGMLQYTLFDAASEYYTGQVLRTRAFNTRVIISSIGVKEERYAVRLLILVSGRRIRAHFTLANRSSQKYPVLVGRNILRGKFLVDVERGHNELIVIEKHSEQATKDFVI
jgi:hypothetical protein